MSSINKLPPIPPNKIEETFIWRDWLSKLPTLVNNVQDLGYYIVTTYGATGDGTTDDTPAIQAAITACAGDGGGVVFFPPGAYKVSTELLIGEKVTLLGSGPKACFFRSSSSTNNILNITGSYCAVRDLGFVSTVTRTAGSFIVAAGEYLDIDNFYMLKPWRGISVTGIFTWINKGLIEDLTPDSTSSGSCSFYFNSSLGSGGELDCYITKVISRALSGNTSTYPSYCIGWKNGTVVHASDCEFLQATLGLYVSPTAGDITNGGKFSNLYFDNITNHCVILQPSSTGVVVDMNFVDCELGAIGGNGVSIVQTGTAQIDGVRIVGCVIQNYTHHTGTGIYITTTANYWLNANIIGNTVGRFGVGFTEGISIAGGPHYWNVSNNICEYANGYGIHITTSSADHFTICNNVIANNADPGVLDTSTGTNKIIWGNTEATPNLSSNTLQITGKTNPTSGTGIELLYDSATVSGWVFAGTRTAGGSIYDYKNVTVAGDSFIVATGGVGSNTEALSINSSQVVNATKTIRVQGKSNPTSGTGIELLYDSSSNAGWIFAGTRGGGGSISSYKGLTLACDTFTVTTGSGNVAFVSDPSQITDFANTPTVNGSNVLVENTDISVGTVGCGTVSSTGFLKTSSSSSPSSSGGELCFAANTSTTASSTPGGYTLPALCNGYLVISLSGTTLKIPCYLA